MDYRPVKRGFPDKEPRVLAVINQKGGVGKTTTVVNLSAALGQTGKKVLVVDFDPQGNATSGYGIDKEELEGDVYDVIMNGRPVEDTICSTVEENVFIVPATIDLAGAEIELVQVEKREYQLVNALRPVRNEFDYILIDCPPSLGLLTIDALVASTALLIPIQCEFYALEGLTKLLETMKMVKGSLNPSLEIFGVVMTMYDSRTSLSKEVDEEVRKYFGNKVFKTVIPRNVKLSEAPSHGLPVNRYARVSKGSQAYAKLAREANRRG
jgi:chromosome partitioning protein